MATSKELHAKLERKMGQITDSHQKAKKATINKFFRNKLMKELQKLDNAAYSELEVIRAELQRTPDTHVKYTRLLGKQRRIQRQLGIDKDAIRNALKQKQEIIYQYLDAHKLKLKDEIRDLQGKLNSALKNEKKVKKAEETLGKAGNWIKKTLKGKGKIALAVAGTGALATGAAYARYKYLEKQRQSKKLAKESLKLWEQYFIE